MSFTYHYGALLFLLCVGIFAARGSFRELSRFRTLNTLGICSSSRANFM